MRKLRSVEIQYKDFKTRIKKGANIVGMARVINQAYNGHWIILTGNQQVFVSGPEGWEWVIKDLIKEQILSASEVELSFRLNDFKVVNRHNLKEKNGVKYEDIHIYDHCQLFFEQCFHFLANKGRSDKQFKALEIE